MTVLTKLVFTRKKKLRTKGILYFWKNDPALTFHTLFFGLLCTVGLAQAPVESVHQTLDRFPNVRDFCLSDAGDEMYFSVQSPGSEISRIGYMVKSAAGWSEPGLMPFSGRYYDLEPFLSPDQKRLYFVSNRPLQRTDGAEKDMDIWYVERKDAASPWSSPMNMGAPVNSDGDEFYPSVTANGNLYFTAERAEGAGKDDIYVCRWDGKTYAAPVLLGPAINGTGLEFNAFVSRNEDFLLFTKYNSPVGLGSGDLFISRRGADGQWQPAETLGSTINTKFMEYCPFYHEKTGTLYFTSRRNALENGDFADLGRLLDAIGGSGNGLSRLYKVAWKP